MKVDRCVRHLRVVISVFLFIICLVFMGQLIKPTGYILVDQNHQVLPLKSFVQVKIIAKATITSCPEDYVGCEIGEKIESPSLASGVILENGQILTAGHVCISMTTTEGKAIMYESLQLNGDNQPEGTIKILNRAVDYDGNMHPVEVDMIDVNTDLCLLDAPSVNISGVKLANQMPHQGSKVYTISAPSGVFSPGMSLIFDGYYAGEDLEDDSYFTIPAAPGSSGSPIFNHQGELIGIIFAAHNDFENLAIAANLDEIRQFLATVGL